ncbi:MAG: hypothetical protein HUJ91_04560, partial [Bacteroidales bacterium]|nr:hypothetical protein [Bacteroidales bacterium]
MFLMTSRLPMISLKEKFTKVHWIMAAVAVILIPVAAILHPARSGFLGFATLLLALLFGCYVVVALLALPFRRKADK